MSGLLFHATAVARDGWAALLTGDAFGKFVDDEFATLRAIIDGLC